MKFRPQARTVRTVGQPLLGALAATWRFRPQPSADAAAVIEGRRACVVVCWHEEILPLLWHHRDRGIGILVSGARDGQYLADLAGALGYSLVRGSSSRGGARALLSAVRTLVEGTSVTFTPDGPRGPRQSFRPGAALAAQRAGVPILPVRATASRAWRLRSWDRMMIPKPAARIEVRYGSLIPVAHGRAPLDAAIAATEQALNLLGAAA
jgi:lysophospholipid acyltransferase (LPLAT)-like uncharacterized protein